MSDNALMPAGDVELDRGTFLPWRRVRGPNQLMTDARDEWAVPSALMDIWHAAQAVSGTPVAGPMVPPSQMSPQQMDNMLSVAGAGAGAAMTGGIARNALAPRVAGTTTLGTGGTNTTPGIRAYHGSPHDFDRFDISKIGTGEGAQAYGRGLYFAESEGVAKSYKEGLGNKTYLLDGKPLQPKDGAEYDAHRLLQTFGPDIDTAIERGKRAIAQGHPVDVAQYTPAVATLEKWKAEGRYKGDNTGRMYEVRINADPEQFLDWDKPLAQQPEAVKKIIEPALRAAALDMGKGATPEVLARFEGMGLKNIADRMRPKKIDPWSLDTVTLAQQYPNALREAGIPGIKYLDQGSRTAGEGSRNYVVFDDKLLEIMRKYGILPPLAAGAAAAGGTDPASAGP